MPPCDEVSFPSVMAEMLENQLELAELLVEPRFDQARREQLVARCARNLAQFAEFIGKYQVQVAPRRRPPERCTAPVAVNS